MKYKSHLYINEYTKFFPANMKYNLVLPGWSWNCTWFSGKSSSKSPSSSKFSSSSSTNRKTCSTTSFYEINFLFDIFTLSSIAIRSKFSISSLASISKLSKIEFSYAFYTHLTSFFQMDNCIII